MQIIICQLFDIKIVSCFLSSIPYGTRTSPAHIPATPLGYAAVNCLNPYFLYPIWHEEQLPRRLRSVRIPSCSSSSRRRSSSSSFCFFSRRISRSISSNVVMSENMFPCYLTVRFRTPEIKLPVSETLLSHTLNRYIRKRTENHSAFRKRSESSHANPPQERRKDRKACGKAGTGCTSGTC